MKSTKLTFAIASLGISASMLLSACGGDTSTPTAVATNTIAAVAPTTGAAATDNTPTAMAAATTGTAPTAGTSGGSNIIKIGIDLPVSGGDASVGIPTRNGMQLAIDQANAKGGVTLGGTTYKLQMYDLDDVPPGAQAHDPAQSSKNADAFISDPDVMVVLGPFNSANAKAMMPKLNTAGLCQISPSNTNETLTKPQFGQTANYRPTGKVTYFRVCATDDLQGPTAADYAYDKLKLKSVYLLDDTEAYGKGIADNFEKEFVKKGGKSLGHDGVTKGTTDYSSIMTKIAGTKPDFIYYGGTSSNNLPLARKQMKAAGLNIPMMGGDGIVDEEFLKVAGADAEGTYATVASADVTTLSTAKQFITDYNAAGFKEALGSYSGPGYDAANIAIDAIKRSGKKDRAAVCTALQNTKNFPGVLGSTSFDQNGDTTNSVITITEAKGGKWVTVDQVNGAVK